MARPGESQTLVEAFIKAIDEARDAANRSVLDGTVSCRICRVLVLEQNADGHYAWHSGRVASGV